MRAVFFPHGGTLSENDVCLWRELSFAFFLVRQAVNPYLSLSTCIREWPSISSKLAERPRKRQKQLKSGVFLR